MTLGYAWCHDGEPQFVEVSPLGPPPEVPRGYGLVQDDDLLLLVRAAKEAVGLGDTDLSGCAYWRSQQGRPLAEGEEPICSYGCSDEPCCVTCQPSDGWPLEKLARALRPFGVEA